MNKASLEKAVSYVSALAPELTQKLQEAAIAAKWPVGVAKSLSITFNGTVISCSYPDEFAKDIEDLEYGTPSQGPSPVLRTFTDKHNDQIVSSLADWAVDDLYEAGALS